MLFPVSTGLGPACPAATLKPAPFAEVSRKHFWAWASRCPGNGSSRGLQRSGILIFWCKKENGVRIACLRQAQISYFWRMLVQEAAVEALARGGVRDAKEPKGGGL